MTPRDSQLLLTLCCYRCLEPSEAPSRVRARAVSASEIQVHWEPLPSGSRGKILAYEVGTKTKKYKVKDNISTRNCPTREDEGNCSCGENDSKTVEYFVSTSQTGGGAAAPYSARLTSAAVWERTSCITILHNKQSPGKNRPGKPRYQTTRLFCFWNSDILHAGVSSGGLTCAHRVTAERLIHILLEKCR